MADNKRNNPYSTSFFGDVSDPYSWAGEVGVEEGKVPIQRWRPTIVKTTPGEAPNKSLTETTSDRAHPERTGEKEET